MMHVQRLVGEFFSRLEKLDERIAAEVAASRCRHCGGPLHQGNYQRKPRGGLIAPGGEAFCLRHSLCCGRRGCRKRALPPSLRFLGRRVYLEVVVVLASVLAQAMATIGAAAAASGVPWRTLRRWGAWWREVFVRLSTWAEIRARFVPPPPSEALMPQSLLVRLEADLERTGGQESSLADVMVQVARCLGPVTTASVQEGSRLVARAEAQTAVG